MQTHAIAAAADRLRCAAETHNVCCPVRDLLGDDVNASYEVQEFNTRHWIARGRTLVGRKIGLTSPQVRAQLGVDEPDYGMLFADMKISNGGTVSMSVLLQPKIEAEIALIMRSPIENPAITAEELNSEINYAISALEIVDSRIANWNIKLVDTVADNASSGMFVLGSEHVPPSQIDWTGCQMLMKRHADDVSRGAGKECMGNPLNAAVWVAKKMIEMGRPIQAGDCILTGALGPMVPVSSGDHFAAWIDGFDSVSVSFT